MLLVGVDYGLARIGLAKSDEERRLAFPHAVIARGASDEEAIGAILRSLEGVPIERFVVGDPIRLDGTVGEASRRARAFAELLEARSGIPCVLVDERLTTSAASKSLRELGVDSRGQKDIIDASAAALLLQTHLDASREIPWESEPDLDDVPPRNGAAQRRRAPARRRRSGR
ncbi:MAG: Holliday junction resolvase RuvX [Sandaracinaceae bacterium]|nr:Holliday junction resolvase RuvX [Sandaracinaceae bacterium]